MKKSVFLSGWSVLICSLLLFTGCREKPRTATSSVLTMDSCSADTSYVEVSGEDTCRSEASLKAMFMAEGPEAARDFINACVMLRLYYDSMEESDTVALCTTSDDMQKEVSRLYGLPWSSLSVSQVMEQVKHKFVDCYKKDTEGLESSMGYDFYVDVTLQQVTDIICTCITSRYVYFGGAHGSSSCSYDNLDLTSGRILGFKDIFKEGMESRLRPLLVKGLCAYFEVEPKDLDSQLMSVTSDDLPLPVSVPGLTEEGVVFQYQEYEIACYAAGRPKVVVPYSDLKDMLKIPVPAK